jgi:REP element-mobilizing transposase RayT
VRHTAHVHWRTLSGFGPSLTPQAEHTWLRLRSEFTGRVNRHLMHGHLWSPSYFAASCGGAPLAIIWQYIEQQKRPVQETSGLTPP